MKTLIKIALISLAAIVIGFGTVKVSEAAGQKFYITDIAGGSSTDMLVGVIIQDGTLSNQYMSFTPVTPYTNEKTFSIDVKNEIANWANTALGFSGITSADVLSRLPDRDWET